MGDKLLAILFVYPDERVSAEVESRKQSEDQCQVQSESCFFFISPHQSRGSAREPSLIEFQFNHFLKVIIQYLFKSQRCAGLKIKSGIAWHCRFYMSQVCGCACGWALRISVGHNKLFLTLLMNVSSTFVRPDAWAGATSSPVPGLSPVQWLSQSQS